jgi:hypothetical protein
MFFIEDLGFVLQGDGSRTIEGNRSKNMPTKVQNKGRKPGLVNFGQFPCPWIRIRIRIPNTDLDPGQPNQ